MMTTTLETAYQPLQAYSPLIADHEESPQESGVIYHVVPESGKAQWNHVGDLDSFFTRVYQYHQKHGFICMVVQEALELIQFLFVVIFTTYLFNCIDYPVLFKDKSPSKTDSDSSKVTISEVIIPPQQCAAKISGAMWFCIFIAFIVWMIRLINVLLHFVKYWEIGLFFHTVLKIHDRDLDNLTWHEIQRKIREVQREQQMCVRTQDLSELDIYHRILRFKNYMVAMVNKSLLPVKIDVPFNMGEVIFLSRGLKYNIELLLFWGPWAPFKDSWHLKEDYKKFNKRKELAEDLSRHILWVGLINLLLSPLILLWQILYSFFNYADILKREPGSLGSRRWSLYGRLYFRHFNELDHELNARLNRAYRPASKYMDSFTSPLMTIVAKFMCFTAGSILAVLLILTAYDEDVIAVQHVLTLMTALGIVVACCRVFIPDENLVWCPEKLMTAVLAHVHYLPDSWRDRAHTNSVREEFSQLFQYTVVHVVEELVSPLVTPLILWCKMRHKALDIVDFFRNFTVEVGVGDVCSFAQMDVRRHGNITWQTSVHSNGNPPAQADQCYQAEDGKTELSLVHFTLTNPDWVPPQDAGKFVMALRQQVKRDMGQGQGLAAGSGPNPLMISLHSVSSLGTEYRDTISHMLPVYGNLANLQGSEFAYEAPEHLNTAGTIGVISPPPARVVRRVSRREGPVRGSEKGLLYSLAQCGPSLGNSMFASNTPAAQVPDDLQILAPEYVATDMSLSTLYLHELHHKQLHRQGRATASSAQFTWPNYQDNAAATQHAETERGGSSARVLAERTPLLATRASNVTNLQ